MLLIDSETKVDLLNNEAIAKTVVALLRERPDKPITIGIHGDWGAGKSSVLEMIEDSLKDDDTILCIKFNGWSYQGFEDAKIALIEGIVTELVDNKPILKKAGKAVQETFKRIDLLKLAKAGGGLVWTASTGVPPPDIIKAVISTLKGWGDNPSSAVTKDNIESVVGNLDGILKPKEERRVTKEIQEFRLSFDTLLKEAKINRLIVLIDDLDRCLPETAIQTLEAMRLLLFVNKTAFVIGSDEAMITYAARQHFPNLPDARDYARNYLEKLIQVPFRLPALGEMETRIYISLLLIGSVVGEESPDFIKVIELGREKLKTPWKSEPIEASALDDIPTDKRKIAKEMLSLSDRIAPMLAVGTNGNPRQIKRFLNALLLRKDMAQARGFGEEINLSVLGKLMLAERFIPNLFEDIAQGVAGSADGTFSALGSLENNTSSDDDNKTLGEPITKWLESKEITHWATIFPKLSNVDMRPYLFIAKDSRDYFIGNPSLERLGSVIGRLMTKKILNKTALTQELAQISTPDVKNIFNEIRQHILGGDYGIKPNGANGMALLVSVHPELEDKLLDFIEELKPGKIGAWVIGNWHQCTLSADAMMRFEGIKNNWKDSGTNAVKTALKTEEK